MDTLETPCFVYGLSIMTAVCIANHHIESTPLNYRAQLKPVLTVSLHSPTCCICPNGSHFVSSSSACWNLPESSKADAFTFLDRASQMPLPGVIFPSPIESPLRLHSGV